jgi:hypothetical protein
MREKRPVLVIFGVAAILVVVFALAWPVARYHYSLSDTADYLAALVTGDERTKYAPGFTEEAFSRVRVGMTRDEVHTLLGEPLVRSSPSWLWPEAGWRYSDQVTGTSHYHQRDISFSRDGRVTEIVRGFYFD